MEKPDKKLIDPGPYKEYLMNRILSCYETDAFPLAGVCELVLSKLEKEIRLSNEADSTTNTVLLNPAALEQALEEYIQYLKKLDFDATAAIDTATECLTKLREQPDFRQKDATETPDEFVPLADFEAMKADRDSWKDAFGESNEKIAAEVKRRETLEAENKRLRAIIAKHLPGDAVCALCKHFAQCKQEALEENDVTARTKSIFWTCDGYSLFAPKEGS